MQKRTFLALLALIVVLAACSGDEEYTLCPDGVTRVLDPAACPDEDDACPDNCDDGDRCTRDYCNAGSEYQCKHDDLIPCQGNGICERGEFPGADDCPPTCDDEDTCTVDAFNYAEQACSHQDIVPCCGNAQCDLGETFVDCPQDCKQRLDLTITSFERRQSLQGAANDLTGTDFTFLIVRFKLANIDYDEEHELDFKMQNGFFYDPYKMRVEDANGDLFDVDLDSDLLDDYLDFAVLPKGHTKGAALLFIIPVHAGHARLIAYDRFGARLDIASIY